MSKGGLLYHFPSKSALYLGLLESVRGTVIREMTERSTGSDGARAFLEYSAPDGESESGFFTSLIAAVRTGEDADPQALALLAEVFRAWEQPLHEAVTDPVRAEIIRLVGNGIYLSAIAGLPQPDPALLARVFDRLLDQDRASAPVALR